MGKWAYAALAGAAALLLTPSPAAAQYLDPGASSVLVQVIFAGLIGVAAILKLYWHKIKELVASFRKPPRGPQVTQREP